MKKYRFLKLAAIAVIAAFTLTIPAFAVKSKAQEKKVMAPDFALKNLSGDTVKLSDYKGKVVLLNFWTTWCKYCKKEMPDLNELNKTFKKDNKVVILEIDVQEKESTVKSFLLKYKYDLNILYDSDGAISNKYGITGFPTTFVINKDGSVFTYVPGLTNKKTIQEILKSMK